jgi:hypothetical protein
VKRYFCTTCWRTFIPPRARILLGVLGALTLVALGIGSAVLANSGEQGLTVVTRRVQVVRTTTGPVEMVTLAPKRVTVDETTTLSGTTKTLPGRTVTVRRAGRTVVVRRPGRTVTVSGPVRVRKRVVLKPVVDVREKRVVVTTPGRTVTTPRDTVTQPAQTSTETRTVNVDRPVTVTTERPVTQTVTLNRPVTTTVTQTQTATQTVTQTQTATQTVTNTVTVSGPPPPPGKP